jgi:hypothetical protein
MGACHPLQELPWRPHIGQGAPITHTIKTNGGFPIEHEANEFCCGFRREVTEFL